MALHSFNERLIIAGATLVVSVSVVVFAVASPQKDNNSNQSPSQEEHVYKSNEVTKAAVILSKPIAQYSEAARKNRVSGTVALWTVLRASGEVGNIRVNVGLPDGLTQAAIDAARKVKFAPAEKDDEKVSVLVKLEYRFVCDPSCHGAP